MTICRSKLLLAGLAWLAVPGAARAQTPPAAVAAAPEPAPEFSQRVTALADILSGKGDYDGYFAPGFRAQVPKAKFDAVTAQLAAAGGAFERIAAITPDSPWSAMLTLDYQRAQVAMRIVVDSHPPHQVTGLLVTGLAGREQSLAEIDGAMAALHGDAGFAVAKLGSGTPQLLAGRHADKPYAIGSAFKLVILAELVRETNAGARKWDDLVTLDGSPLPGGGYTTKPKGTQVSLRELATQMISISDNSATDILLKTLGREKVEAMMPVLGIADPARNRPFLGTLEVFKLKGIAGLGDRYLALDEAGKRALLNGEIANIPPILINMTSFNEKIPARIDRLEWFESPNDLVRVLDWLRRNTEGPGGADARAVLSKNPGLPPAVRGEWQWAGYKGGSEPGVMNLSYLLQAKTGDWYVVTASWNDPAQAVDETRFLALVTRAVELAAP